jgi:hypothetical protein
MNPQVNLQVNIDDMSIEFAVSYKTPDFKFKMNTFPLYVGLTSERIKAEKFVFGVTNKKTCELKFEQEDNKLVWKYNTKTNKLSLGTESSIAPDLSFVVTDKHVTELMKIPTFFEKYGNMEENDLDDDDTHVTNGSDDDTDD